MVEAFEDALRNDPLPYMTCTSTLTERINLPVRDVVVHDTMWAARWLRMTGAELSTEPRGVAASRTSARGPDASDAGDRR
jgi:hypothetical protein